MTGTKQDEWVVVAQFNAIDTGLAADMAVSKLQGSGILAMRFPTGVMTSTFDSISALVGPVRVLVPPDQAERAREILAEERSSDGDTPGDS